MSDFSQFPSPRLMSFLVGKFDTRLIFTSLSVMFFTSNSDFLNILAMGLFHYYYYSIIWNFSKGFHIFVRGVYIDSTALMALPA